MNIKIIIRCLLFGIYLTIQGMVLQVGKAVLFFHSKPPAPDFIIEVTLLYFITGFLFALGYFLLIQAIPGKSKLSKGLNYSLLVYFGIAFGNLIGVIGFDFQGKYNLFTLYKIENYAIALADFINFTLAGTVLGLTSNKTTFSPSLKQMSGKKLMTASAAGFFVFPGLSAGLLKLVSFIIPLKLKIPSDRETWFYMGIFIPLTVTGL